MVRRSSSTRASRSRTTVPRRLAAVEAMADDAASNVPALLAELRGLGSERNRQGMARYGINVERAFGVSIAALRPMARRLGADHALALALWSTGFHEGRLLACLVDDPAAVGARQMEAWARRMLASTKRRAGSVRGGSADVRAARFVASDAARELTSPTTRARLERKSLNVRKRGASKRAP